MKKANITFFTAIFAMFFMLGVSFSHGGPIEKPVIELTKSNSNTFSFISTAYAQDEVTIPVVAPTGAPAEGTLPVLPGMEDDPGTDLDAGTFLKALIASVGSFKGAGALAIAAVVLQLLLLFFRTTLATFAGKWRLLIVYVLSLAAGVLALKVSVSGMEWVAALVHAHTLAAAQVLIHQVKKQFWDKKDEVVT